VSLLSEYRCGLGQNFDVQLWPAGLFPTPDLKVDKMSAMNNYQIVVQKEMVDADVCYITDTIFLSGFGLLAYYIKYSVVSVFWRSGLSPLSRVKDGQDEGSMFFHYISNQLPDYMVS
jgi:hypothetical protein